MRTTNKIPSAFVLLSSLQGTFLVNRHDYILSRSGGGGVGYELLENSAFESTEIDLMLRLLSFRQEVFGTGVVALDCGANIGIHTVEFARHMYGWGTVLSFEAQERVFYALAGNLTINNCFNARAIWAAVGSELGFIDVPIPDYFKPSSFGSLELKKRQISQYIGQDIDYSASNCSKTQLITIDSLELARLDFIKMDIEGMEEEAILGAELAVKKHKPIIFCEIVKSDATKISSLLVAQGYELRLVTGNILAIHKSDPSIKIFQ